MNHEEAMKTIYDACSFTTMSYEECIAIYLRARGILRDKAKYLGDPIPKDWEPAIDEEEYL